MLGLFIEINPYVQPVARRQPVIIAMFYIISSIESNIKQRNYNLVIALILVLLSSAIDNHLWDMAFNIVFLGMFADVQSDNEIVGIENESNTK